MKQPRHKLANWFSYNQHKKRFGAKTVSANMSHDWQTMKQTIITGESLEYTYGSDKNLANHIDNLKKEFVNQPEINYYHAKLIVLIRRGVEANKNFKLFEDLWHSEHAFLTQSLNTRWLISACDTFIDDSDDALLQALLMNAVILINTIKLQESERYLLATENQAINEARKQSLQNERLALFDGTSGFAVGTDDTIRNMRWRLDKLAKQHTLGSIVTEVFERIQQPENNTVYSRFRALHTREKTAWWQE